MLAIAVVVMAAVYLVFFLHAENQWTLGGLFALAVGGLWAAARFGLTQAIGNSVRSNPKTFDGAAVISVIAVGAVLYDDHFALLMLTTALLLTSTALGLTVQFGYAGIANFAGAAFLGIGCYTAAVLTQYSALPPILGIPLGGLIAALIGSVLILPVLRTRGHYAALITIAFGILFKTFLEVNDTLGGPQGMLVKPLVLFDFSFGAPIRIGAVEASFYLAYFLLALLLLVFSFGLVRRLERSWIGLSLDSIRLDEIASACFGLEIARWKVIAFTLGNFLAGAAGAVYAHMIGFIAPNNFTFGDSLILVSIVLLGGIGNPWGVSVAAAFVVLLPEKFQIIQEYRFLLYAVLVILILLFRPEGLLPRRLRDYVPGRRERTAT